MRSNYFLVKLVSATIVLNSIKVADITINRTIVALTSLTKK